MYRIDYDNPVKVHFIGIGGISMSGLAEILLDRGFTISGSDRAESELTKQLEDKGITVYYGQCAGNIRDDVELVVYTAAIREDNEEFIEVKRRGIPMLTRAELLGQIMKNYEVAVAVSGTHGKTTTTSMITDILISAGLDPTISVGGMLKEIGGNIRIGRSGYFVTEACEYTNSFLSFYPTVGVILNIEEDHLDFFKDINDIRASFKKFAELLPDNGLLIINADIKDHKEITQGLKCKVVTVSFTEGAGADYTACGISYDELGCASFEVCAAGREARKITLHVPGAHNIGNALAAIALADHLNIDSFAVTQGLMNFHGTDRRFQYKGSLRAEEGKGITGVCTGQEGGTENSVTVIDDYAHHPTEIRATLNAAANYPHKRVICVFQPHTYTRTKAFFDDFVDALTLADVVVLAEIYAARETDTLNMSSSLICEELKKKGKEAYYFSTFSEIEDFLQKKCLSGDLLITMGAGDVVKIGEELFSK
ncbi:MAG: UDP-N-acetylmuramate--L-alanine ligase [Lachnospiraceae bacterium]|nr:UDP-N-acetylmuramate--L-alanine ligase [Lachnospiraceae bacterium]